MPGERLSIRSASISDLEIVAELFHATDVHYWGAAAPSLTRMTEHVRNHVLASKACEVVIAELDACAVGMATFAVLFPAPNLGGQLFMKDLFVVDSARGAGIGRALMRHLARDALARGCVRFDWTAERDNPDALKFYASLGAETVPEKVYFRLTGADLQAMAEER